MRITNLGQNNVPYKLGNIIYHFDKFLTTYKNFGVNDESLYYYNVHLKQHGLEDLIINIGPETLLSSVLFEIFEQGQWLEISESMDYKPSERNMLNHFFESFKNEWKNNTPDYQEFFSELLQENLDDLVITEDDGTAVSQKALQLINAQQQVSDERNVDAGSKLENDSLIAMGHYHNVMLDTTDNAGEFIYNIIKDLNDSADELGYSEQEKFNLIKWGITGIVEDRLFTPSSVETNEMYDTPNYNISKQEFLDIFKFWINHLDNIGLDFDVVDLVMKIYKIEDKEDKFQITSFDIDNQSKINDYIEITFSFVTGINTKEYGEATVYPVLDENSNIDYIKSKIIIDSLEDDYFNEYNTDSDFKNELDNYILDNIDIDLIITDDDLPTSVSFDSETFVKAENIYATDCIQGTMAFMLNGLRHTINFKFYRDDSYELMDLYNNEGETDNDDLTPELEERLGSLLEENVNKNLFPEDDFEIQALNVSNEKLVSRGSKVSTFIHGDFDFTLVNDDMSYNGTFKCFNDKTVEIEEIYDENSMTVDKYDKYLEDIEKEISENVDLDLFNDDDFTITEFSLNNQELDEDNNYIVGTFSCNIGGEGENAEFRVWEEFSKDKKVLNVEINGLNEKNQIEYDKFDDFSVELDELIKESINTDLWPQDVEDRDFKITNFQILNETLIDNQIEGSFSCNIDDDYQIAQFTYQNETSEQDEIIQIFDLDEDIDTEFEKGGEFTNQLENFLRDNIDMDLFDTNNDIENARPVEDNNIEVELVIEKLNSTKFPNPQVEFYYPHLNIESTEIVSKEKVIEFLNLLLNDDEFGGNFIVDDYTLKTLSPDYLSFNELLNKIMNIIPDSDFEDNEDVLYMVISNDLKIKLSVGAVIWNYLNDNFKR